MNGTEALIFLSFTLVIASLGAALYLQAGEKLQTEVKQEEQSELRISNVIGQNISNKAINHIRISVQTDGVLSLDDTLLIIRTDNDTARLQYRNGTLTRDVATGFYTQ